MIRRATIFGIVISGLLLPATASATWGKNCKFGNEHHCYAVAEWSMSGSGEGGGEEVKGVSSELETTSMHVPLWENGDFITNEQWMVDTRGDWAEDGQIGGYNSATEEGREVNGTSLHWFYAYEEPYNGFGIFVAPWTYEGFTPIQYTLWDPENNGWWCEKIELVQVSCQTSFKKYATDIEVGMEAADEEQPENAGRVYTTGAQHLNGGWYNWNSAEWRTVNYNGENESAYVCATGWKEIAAYIRFGTPNNKC